MKNFLIIIIFLVSCVKSPEKMDSTPKSLTNTKEEIITVDKHSNQLALENEVNTILFKAHNYLKESKFDEATKTYKELLESRFKNYENPESSLSSIITDNLYEVDCAKNIKGINQKPRSKEEVVKELLDAIKNQNKIELLKLVGCKVYATESRNWWYPPSVTRDFIADILIQRIKPNVVHVVEKFIGISDNPDVNNFDYTIHNGKKQDSTVVYIRLGTTPHAPDTLEINGVAW